VSYDAWLEEPYQREAAAEDRDDRADDEVGTDCGCFRDEGDDKCRARVQCDECGRATALGEVLTAWVAEDAETGKAIMPPAVAAYFGERDERRAERAAILDGEDDDCCEPDGDWDLGTVREP